jgi:hypothetical protein
MMSTSDTDSNTQNEHIIPIGVAVWSCQDDDISKSKNQEDQTMDVLGIVGIGGGVGGVWWEGVWGVVDWIEVMRVWGWGGVDEGG